jgi:hypothetical protein
MSLPTTIPRVKEGEFISAESYNKLVDVCEALVRGQGRNGVDFYQAEAGFIWRGSGTGSGEVEPPTPGTATNFRGGWSSLVTYAAGDVVFTNNTTNQAANKAHTYVSKLDGNINNVPPDTLTAFEDSWWRLVAFGSWTSLVVGDSTVAPVDERLVTLVPGAGEFYISGSGGTGEGTDDTTQIIGGVVDIAGRLTVTGPVVIQFPNSTEIILDVSDIKDKNDDPISGELDGRVFKMRLLDICDEGIERKIGVIATEIFD